MSSDSLGSTEEPTTNADNRLPERPSFLAILSILTGVPVALWSYKCLMMVLFQRKIIYMPNVPLGARNERLEDVPKFDLRHIECRQISIKSEKRVTLSGILVKPELTALSGNAAREQRSVEKLEEDPDTVLMYFQGNAGTPLLLIPLFRTLLSTLHPSPRVPPPPPTRSSPSYFPKSSPHFTAIISPAPRSYWKSTRRTPTQYGLTTDYLSTLHYTLTRFPRSSIVLFGHSLGAAAAICLLSMLHDSKPPMVGTDDTPSAIHSADFSRIRGLILENPIPSIPSMVRTLYPQKYLPYRYLGPFVWDKWDAEGTLRGRGTTSKSSVLDRLAPDALVIQSENDEVVPREKGKEMYSLLQAIPGGRDESQIDSLGKFVLVKGALHNTAWTKPTWANEIKAYLERLRPRI